MYDVAVIGGGIAGMTAAIYIRRAGKTVLVIEPGNFGGQITTSPNVENYPGFKNISGMELGNTLFEQMTELGADVELDMVKSIKNENGIKKIITNDGEFEAKSVIIATGAKHRHLGIEREEELVGGGVSYCAVCDGAFFKGKKVAVVGGGSAALQSAMHLSANCEKVYLVHRRDEFRGEERLAMQLEKRANVEFVLNSTVEKLKGENELSGIVVKDKMSGEEKELSLEGLFIAIGQIPDNEAFKDAVSLDEYGYIIAGEDCKTSQEGIFVAGDCRTKKIRQLTTAAADGTIAALAACDYVDM